MTSNMPALIEMPMPQGNESGIHLKTGDFAAFSHEQVVHVINTQAIKTHKALMPFEGNRSPLVTERLGRLMDGIQQLKAHTENSKNYPEGAKQKILDRFDHADQEAEGTNMITRARERLSQFAEPPRVVSDLDGTLTVLTDMHGHILERLPGSFIAEPILAEKGREAFGEVFVSTWQPILKDAPDIFRAAADGVPIRPGVGRFLSETRAIGIQTTVLSANFQPFVEGVMAQIPEAEGVEVIAVKPDDIRATAKSDVLNHMAMSNPDSTLIYLGDGSSDINAITPLVACYFALDGSQFSDELTARGITHLTYRDFNDVADAFRLIYPDKFGATGK